METITVHLLADEDSAFSGKMKTVTFKMSWLHRPFAMRALPDLPRSLSYTDRRSVQVFVSDIREGTEKGRVVKVVRYCPEHFTHDLFIPPNLCYKNCFLQGSTVPLTLGGPSIKNLVLRDKPKSGGIPSVVNGVVLPKNAITHVTATHSLNTTDSKFFMSQRAKSFFQRLNPLTGEIGNSVFICVTLVVPLIKATLLFPDKVTQAKGGRIAHERCFKTEVGHDFHGCCHIVKVITEYTHTHTGATQKLVTAYPTSHFSPS